MIAELVSHFALLGVTFYADGAHLAIDGPADVLTDDVREMLHEREGAILAAIGTLNGPCPDCGCAIAFRSQGRNKCGACYRHTADAEKLIWRDDLRAWRPYAEERAARKPGNAAA